MADKSMKAKQSQKPKPAAITRTPVKVQQPEKLKSVAVKPVEKEKKEDREKTQPKKPNRIALWWRETMGELRKVSWPTIPEARRLTYIVLIVTGVTSLVLGLLDWVFSQLIGLLVTL